MNRQICAVLAILSLTSAHANAAATKVEAAIKTFNAVAGDAGKLKTFCAMSNAMKAGENEKDQSKLATLDKEVEGYMQTLGADFQSAWNAGEELNPDTEDGKAYYGALDSASAKCT